MEEEVEKMEKIVRARAGRVGDERKGTGGEEEKMFVRKMKDEREKRTTRGKRNGTREW
ncbi:MAG: hypothetical protein ABSF68_11980 [Candidatus Acidiferrales bacterium]